jgi:hypothetical protein
MTLKAGNPGEHIQFFVNTTDLAANKAQELIAPCDGWIGAIRTNVQATITTGGTVTVKTGPALAVTVANLSHAISVLTVGDVKQTVLTDRQRGDATCYVTKGTRISIQLASFATAGAFNGYLSIATADTSPQAGFTTPSGA